MVVAGTVPEYLIVPLARGLPYSWAIELVSGVWPEAPRLEVDGEFTWTSALSNGNKTATFSVAASEVDKVRDAAHARLVYGDTLWAEGKVAFSDELRVNEAMVSTGSTYVTINNGVAIATPAIKGDPGPPGADGSGGAPATNTVYGTVKLAGDLAGSAATPTVPKLNDKVNSADLGELVDDRVAGLLKAGSNVTLTYNDVAGTLTIASAGGSSGGGGSNLGGIVSVTDYGAVADYNYQTQSGTNNRQAIINAIAACPVGGTVWFPPGEYYCSDEIPLNKMVALEASIAGLRTEVSGARLVFPSGKNGIRVSAPSGWRISGLQISSLATGLTTGVGILVTGGSSDRGDLHEVKVTDFGSHGIHLLAGNTIQGQPSSYVSGNANMCNIDHPQVYGCFGDGIRLEGDDTNACVISLPDVVANRGYGISTHNSCAGKINWVHADQTYFGSPGMGYENGAGNVWLLPYSESAAPLVFGPQSESGIIRYPGNFGKPNITDPGSRAKIMDLGSPPTVGKISNQYGATRAVTSSDDVIVCDGAGITVTLQDPTTVTKGRPVYIKNVNASAVTVNSAGTSKTVDGAASKSLAQWACGRFISDGTRWLTI